MAKKIVVGPGLTPDWVRKRSRIMRAIDDQLALGLERPGAGLTLDQLQWQAVEHRCFCKKKSPENPPTESEKIWQLQMAHLREKGYVFDNKDIPLPDEAKLKLGPALLVDYQTPIDRQLQLLGIGNYLDLNKHQDLHPKPQGFGWIYEVENGKKMLGVSPNQAIQEFQRNNRKALMTVEGLALLRENPDLLKDHYVDFSSSRFGSSDRVPLASLNDGRPELDWCFADYADVRWGSASRGS